MKTCLVCFLFIFSHIALSQLEMEPSGPLKKKIKSDSDKIRLGLSAQIATADLPVFFQLIFSVNAYHKNKQFSAGPILYLYRHELPPNVIRKEYGYNLAGRFIFPQNKGIAKAFIPLEFEHYVRLNERTEYYYSSLPNDHLPGLSNPGYSFNLKTKSNFHRFSLRTGLGLYIWLHDHFNVVIQATLGPDFSMIKAEYINTDTGDLVDSEMFKLRSDGLSGSLSAGFGFRF